MEAAPAHAGDLVTPHCLGACPRGDRAEGNRVVVRSVYTLSSNPVTKLADWVAYVVAVETFGPSRDRQWRSDPDIPAAATLEPDDYTGAHQALGTDRGHQAPLASLAGSSAWAETNYLSNITPQRSAMNQGPWVRLETAVRRVALRSNRPIHVITGPLYERVMPSLPGADEAHLVPSGYFKVIVAGASEAAAAFLMDQALEREADYCAQAARLDEVERRAGLSLFPDHPAAGDAADKVLAALGC